MSSARHKGEQKMEQQEGKGTILVVDDNENNRAICKDNLEMEGCQVLLANNGEQGLNIAKEQKPDLILLDIMMPVMDGFEFLERLKADPELANIPVLMLTAKSESKDVVRALESGAQDYLTKPFAIDELIARVNTLVRLKKVEDQLRASVSKNEHLAILGTMAAGVAHDFKNVLAILTWAEIIEINMELLSEKIPDNIKQEFLREIQEIQEAVVEISEAREFGVTLCQGLTAFANASAAGKAEYDLAEVLQAPLKMFDRRLRGRDISLKTNLNKTLPIICNKAEIQRVLLNLITNALYAMEKKDPKILSICIWENVEDVRLSVSDTGVGICDEILSYIFNEFFTTKNDRGSGIGLDTVKKIMKSHGGSIAVQTKVGEGTTFTLSFPKKQND